MIKFKLFNTYGKIVDLPWIDPNNTDHEFNYRYNSIIGYRPSRLTSSS